MPQIDELAKPTSQRTGGPARAVVPAWLITVGLLVLGAIPLTAGAFRLIELAGGADVTPANARFFGSPLPVVLHIVAAAAYIVLGASSSCRASGAGCPAGTVG